MPRKAKAPVDGTPEAVTTSIAEVADMPPSEDPLPAVRKSGNKTKFDTAKILEAAHPDHGATVYTDLVRLTGYVNDASFRTRVSQLVNTGKIDKSFRPEKPSKKAVKDGAAAES